MISLIDEKFAKSDIYTRNGVNHYFSMWCVPFVQTEFCFHKNRNHVSFSDKFTQPCSASLVYESGDSRLLVLFDLISGLSVELLGLCL